MKPQMRFALRRRDKPTIAEKTAKVIDTNLQAARIIASQPDKYQGSLLTWARLVVARADGLKSDNRMAP